MKRKAILGMGVLCIAALYMTALLDASNGRPVAPLDDAYIHFQYARQITRGHPWQYNDGDPYSTGATSPLYPFLLAAGYLLGFRGERLVWFALGLGVVSLALSAWLVYRITARLVADLQPRNTVISRWAPASATLFFLLTGAVQWIYLSGMESGPFTVLVLAAFNAFLADPAPSASRASLWLALAALVRPEGLILTGVLWLVVAGRTVPYAAQRPQRAARDALPVTLAVLASTLPLLLNLALTGSPVATGAQAKSWLGNVPFRLGDILESIAHGYRLVLERFLLGLWATRPWFLAPGFLLLVGVGWIALLRRRRWSPVFLTAGWFFLGLLSTALLITVAWQVGRYQAPFLALLVPVATVGFVALFQNADRSMMRRLFAAALALALLVAVVHSTLNARALYARAVGTVAHQQLAIAEWIARNLPPDVRVGVHDTGAIRYVGARPTYDMIGLTTQGAAIAWRHGAGAAFERVEHSPARPDYFATYPDVFSIPYLAATDLFAVELFRVEVPDFVVASAGPTQAVYRADWRLADSGTQVYQTDIRQQVAGLVLTDRLDLADLDDEAAHGLRFWEGVVRPGFPTEVQQYRYRTDPAIEVLDGGRLVTGGLTFRLAARAGEPLLLVARLHAAQAGAVRVEVDGHDVGLWRYPALPGEWLETRFLIPAAAVTRDRVVLRLEVAAPNPDFRHYALYHLWAYAGELVPPATQPIHPLDARLGEAVRLDGYDLALPDPTVPGSTLQLVLYWQAVSQPDEDAQVFVHLYDASGEIAAQQDRRPYYGTRPPYTWSPGETLADPYTLTLPSDLPPGRYTLAVGMYDPVTLARLPVVVDAAHQLPDDRVFLTGLEITQEVSP